MFHPTDPSYREVPGPAPRVYLEADIDAVPRVKMRSVGIIEVTAGDGRRAVEIASEKGRQLGCWILVEHSVFATVRSRTSVQFGARIYLAHGGAPHVSTTRVPRKSEFDCVVQDDITRAGLDRQDVRQYVDLRHRGDLDDVGLGPKLAVDIELAPRTIPCEPVENARAPGCINVTADPHRRLGTNADQPRRIKYKAIRP